MTHTPGPWTTNANIGKKSELGIVANAAPCIIAIMGNQKAWPEEARANAALIAAAPELLNALQDCLSALDFAVCELSRERYENMIVSPGYTAARAAIRRARGQA